MTVQEVFLSLHGSYSVLYWSSRPTVVILQCVHCVSVKATNPPKVTLGRRLLRVLWFSALSIIPPVHHYHNWFTYHRRYTNFANDSASLNTHSYHRRPFSSILPKFNNTNTRADNSPPTAIPYSHSLLLVAAAGGTPCHGPCLLSRVTPP